MINEYWFLPYYSNSSQRNILLFDLMDRIAKLCLFTDLKEVSVHFMQRHKCLLLAPVVNHNAKCIMNHRSLSVLIKK